LLGFHIDNLSLQETVDRIETIIEKRETVQHVVLNVGKIVQARMSEGLQSVVNSCGLVNADGVPIVWMSKMLGKPLKERVAGIDLMQALVKSSVFKSYKLYFLGAKEEVIRKVVEYYKHQFSDIKIAGFRNGYWISKEEEKIVKDIRDSKADILFVAISSPYKEMFLNKYLYKLKVPFVMGVGGSFDVIAGKTCRAPRWMQKMGMEWFFRLIQEPRRMWKRYLIGNTIFIWLVIKEMVKKYDIAEV